MENPQGGNYAKESLNMDGVIPILMYHSISRQSGAAFFRPYAVPPERFAEQMAYLYNNGYTTLGVTQLIEARQKNHIPERCVVITFDDGFADFYVDALPVLKRYNQTASVYITTGYVGATSLWMQPDEGNRPMLTWEQIKAIQEAGVEIGAHSHTHPQQLDVLPVNKAYSEITRSKELLEQQLDRPILSFAYPHGCHSPSLCQMLKRAGYTSACAVKYAFSTPTDNPFALARIIITPDTDQQKFAASVVESTPVGWKNSRTVSVKQLRVRNHGRCRLTRLGVARYRRQIKRSAEPDTAAPILDAVARY